MTTDTAAVEAMNAALSYSDNIEDFGINAAAEVIKHLAAQGFHLLSWNHDMSQAPRDGTLILAYAPAAHGLDEIVRVCGWHPDAGFCICELREVTAWCHLMPPPRETK